MRRILWEHNIILGVIVTMNKNKLIIYAARTLHTDLIVINKQYENEQRNAPHIQNTIYCAVCMCIFVCVCILVQEHEQMH